MATKPCKGGFYCTHNALIAVGTTRAEARKKLMKIIWG